MAVSAMGALVTREEIGQAAADKGLCLDLWVDSRSLCGSCADVAHSPARENLGEGPAGRRPYRQWLKQELGGHPPVGDIRGIGMEIGIDLVKDPRTKEKDTERKMKIIEQAFMKGLHLTGDAESTIQLMPPLKIDRKSLDEGWTS
jgi:4-aminobutyrate aminotransferase-like enzyme